MEQNWEPNPWSNPAAPAPQPETPHQWNPVPANPAQNPHQGQRAATGAAYGPPLAHDPRSIPHYQERPQYAHQGQWQHPRPGAEQAAPNRSKARTPLLLVGALACALIGGGVGASVTALGPAPVPTAPSVVSTVNTEVASFAQVATNVEASVVKIEVAGGAGSGVGSGFVYRSDGMIVTNNHVASGGGTNPRITVTFSDGTTASAKIVGVDPASDLAVIKVDKKGLKAIPMGDDTKLSVGDPVLAVGSPLGLGGTVTSGIVSALNRPVDTTGNEGSVATVFAAIQTDAAINPGNSGGPLVNAVGQVVGVNSAIASISSGSGQAGSIGLGFAIPAGTARAVADELIRDGKAQHAVMGVSPASSAGLEDAAVIGSVEADGAAARAGLKVGDTITRVGGMGVTDFETLLAAVRSHRPGEKVSVTYTRAGDSAKVDVTLTGRE